MRTGACKLQTKGDTLGASVRLLLDRVEKLTLQERVYCELRDALMAGRFLPGTPVTLRGLAEQLGVSSMPVRESLMRLVAERAMEVMPNRTVRISNPSHDRVRELWRVRMEIEGHAAARAAELRTEDELANLRSTNEAFRDAVKAGHLEDLTSANQRFHFTLYDAAHSEVLSPIIQSLWMQAGPFLRMHYPEHFAQAQKSVSETYRHYSENHNRIIEAVAERDSKGARRELVKDLKQAADWFEANVFSIAGGSGN